MEKMNKGLPADPPIAEKTRKKAPPIEFTLIGGMAGKSGVFFSVAFIDGKGLVPSDAEVVQRVLREDYAAVPTSELPVQEFTAAAPAPTLVTSQAVAPRDTPPAPIADDVEYAEGQPDRSAKNKRGR